jgi:Fic family protein
MHYLIKDYKDGMDRKVHPIELISLFHQRFEEIHPFQDVNGRTGREIVNYILKQHGYPQIFIPVEARQQYMDALLDGNNSKFTTLIDFIISRLNETMWLYLSHKMFDKIIRHEGFKKVIVDNIDESYYQDVLKRLEDIKKAVE